MIVNLNAQGLQSLEHICAFLEGTRNLGFEVPFHNREATYDWVAGSCAALATPALAGLIWTLSDFTGCLSGAAGIEPVAYPFDLMEHS